MADSAFPGVDFPAVTAVGAVGSDQIILYHSGKGSMTLTELTAYERAQLLDSNPASTSTTKAPTVAAFKTFVYSVAAGQAWKDPVRAASLTNVNLATDCENGDTFGGVTLATGDRIAPIGQTAAADRGVYIVQATGAAVRATDMDADADFPGATFMVLEGTFAGKQYTCNNPVGSVVVGTTALTFVQSNAGTTTYAGDEVTIHLSGNTFSVMDNAVSYAKFQNASTTKVVLARVPAGAGDYGEATTSQVLDFIGTPAQGGVLTRGASAWQFTGPGTAGQFFVTGGAGADPAWTTLTQAMVPGLTAALVELGEAPPNLSAIPPSPAIYATFAGASAAVTSYTDDTGNTYTNPAPLSFATPKLNGSGQLYGDNNVVSAGIVYSSVSTLGANQTATIHIRKGATMTGTVEVGIVVRGNGTDGYIFRHSDTTGNFELRRLNAGTPTTLDTDAAFTMPAEADLRFGAAGTSPVVLAGEYSTDGGTTWTVMYFYSDASASRLTTAGTVGITLTNTAGGATNGYLIDTFKATTLASVGFHGDSIPAGLGLGTLTDRWTSRVAAYHSWLEVNDAVSGTQAADAGQTDVITGLTIGAGSQNYWLTGYNDMRYYGANAASQDDYAVCVLALLGWMAIPTASHVNWNSASVTYRGTWSNNALFGPGLAYSNVAGDYVEFMVTGTSIFIASARAVTNVGTLEIRVDNTLVGTLSMAMTAATGNLRNSQPAGFLVSGLVPGKHLVRLTSTGSDNCYFGWAAGLDGTNPGAKVVVASGLHMGSAGVYALHTPYNNGSDALADLYGGLVRDAADRLAAAGLGVVYRPVALAPGLTDYQADLVHPTAVGHHKLAQQIAPGVP